MAEPRKYSGNAEIYVGWPGGEGDHVLEELSVTMTRVKLERPARGQHLVRHVREFGLCPKGSVKPLNDFKQASGLIRFMFRNIFLLQCVEHNIEK